MSDLTSFPTDPGSPDPTRTELASRLVDGDLDEVERAAVVDQTDVADQAVTFRAISQLVAEVPPLDPRAADQLLTTALAEHQRPPVLLVPKIEDRRARRNRRAMVWVGAAAAVALVVVGIGIMGDDGSDDADVATPAADESAEELSTASGTASATPSDDGSAAERPAGTEAPAGAEAPTATLAADAQIVPVDDAVALAELARDSEPLTGEVPCAATVEFIPVAYATFRGTDVVVMRNESGRLAYAFDLSTCKQVLFSPIS